MSAMAVRRFTAAVADDDKRRAAAQRRAAERRAYARLHCNCCDTQLLTPARLCGVCNPRHDPWVALAALDKESPAATGLSTTHGGNP